MEKATPHYKLTEILSQNVYHGQWKGIALYIKIQRAGEYFVVSFKEL
jgi:hypothetical protein